MSKPVKKRSSVLSGVFLLAGSRLCVGGKLAPRGGMSTMWTGAVEVANIAPYTFTLVKQGAKSAEFCCRTAADSERWVAAILATGVVERATDEPAAVVHPPPLPPQPMPTAAQPSGVSTPVSAVYPTVPAPAALAPAPAPESYSPGSTPTAAPHAPGPAMQPLAPAPAYAPTAGQSYAGVPYAPAPAPGSYAPAPAPGSYAPVPAPGSYAPAPAPGSYAPAPAPGSYAPVPDTYTQGHYASAPQSGQIGASGGPQTPGDTNVAPLAVHSPAMYSSQPGSGPAVTHSGAKDPAPAGFTVAAPGFTVAGPAVSVSAQPPGTMTMSVKVRVVPKT